MDIMSFKRAPIFLSFRLQIDIDWIIKGDFIIQTPSSNGSKVMGCQSWLSKKFLDRLGSRLRFSLVNRCSPSGPGSNPGQCKL